MSPSNFEHFRVIIAILRPRVSSPYFHVDAVEFAIGDENF